MKSICTLIFFSSLALTGFAQYSFKKYVGTSYDERPYGMRQGSDGYFYVFGSKGSENHIIKLNQLGNSSWLLTYNGNSAGDHLMDMVESVDGDILFGGIAQWQMQSGNARITEVSKKGKRLFDTIYPAPTRGGSSIIMRIKQPYYFGTLGVGQKTDEKPTWLFQKYDYNLKRIGYKFTSGLEGNDVRLITFLKDTLSSGYTIWSQKLVLKIDSNGTTTRLQDITNGGVSGPIIGVVQNANGTYTSVAEYGSDDTAYYFIQLHDGDGKLVNRKPLGNPFYQPIKAINKTADGGFILAGYNLRLLDSNWNEVWVRSLVTEGDSVDIKGVAQAQDGGFYGYGLAFANFNMRNYDFFVFKTTPQGTMTAVDEKQQQGVQEQLFKVYPNPSSSGIFTVDAPVSTPLIVTITDITGKTVLSEPLQQTTIDLSNYPSGLYALQLTDGDGILVYRQKMIKTTE